MILIMMELNFLWEKISKIETKNSICINVFSCENKLVFPIFVSNKKFKNSMDLLLIINDTKSHYVYMKDFNRFMFHKMKNKNKKNFCKSCLQCFSSIMCWQNIKKFFWTLMVHNVQDLKKEWFSLKIIPKKYHFHLKFMLILSLI